MTNLPSFDLNRIQRRIHSSDTSEKEKGFLEAWSLVNLHGAVALAPQNVHTLIRALDDVSPCILLCSIGILDTVLAENTDRQSALFLKQLVGSRLEVLLVNEDPHIRSLAVSCTARFAVHRLCEWHPVESGLNDPHPDVRFTAVCFLEHITEFHQACIKSLQEVIESSDERNVIHAKEVLAHILSRSKQ